MNKALHSAVRLQTRREHSLAELAEKLTLKGHADSDIETALAFCLAQGLQSDERYAESLCRTRIQQGYGPERIRQELKTKGVAREYIDAVLDKDAAEWIAHARDVWHKKYALWEDASFAAKQRQRQFLRYRGFSMDIIMNVVP